MDKSSELQLINPDLPIRRKRPPAINFLSDLGAPSLATFLSPEDLRVFVRGGYLNRGNSVNNLELNRLRALQISLNFLEQAGVEVHTIGTSVIQIGSDEIFGEVYLAPKILSYRKAKGKSTNHTLNPRLVVCARETDSDLYVSERSFQSENDPNFNQRFGCDVDHIWLEDDSFKPWIAQYHICLTPPKERRIRNILRKGIEVIHIPYNHRSNRRD
jgi:hypothetical protein